MPLTQYGCPDGETFFFILVVNYLEDSDRFCVKCGCKRKLLDGSTSGTKKWKFLKEYVKEKGNERGGFLKAKFQLSKNNSKDLKKSRKSPNLRSEVLINVGLIETNEKGVVAIKRGSRLATKVVQLKLLMLLSEACWSWPIFL